MTPHGEDLRSGPPYGGDLAGRVRPLSPDCPKTNPPAHLYWGYHCLHDMHLRVNYGLTCADYYRMLARQGGGCGACGRKQQQKAFAVDHDHETNEVRGLLCDRCNRAVTKGMAKYLISPPAREIGPFFVPADRVEAMERRRQKKAAARKARTKTKSKAAGDGSAAYVDRLRAMTKGG